MQGGPKKRGHELMTIIFYQILTDLHFFTGRFPGKFVVKWSLKISPLLAYVATVTLYLVQSINVRKQAISDKLQGIYRVAII